jgi:hypothetical protein
VGIWLSNDLSSAKERTEIIQLSWSYDFYNTSEILIVKRFGEIRMCAHLGTGHLSRSQVQSRVEKCK